ncbi:MAG: ABC transporter permease [Chitinophagaceae bacterium]|nr:ABC transporter permease [Chitinophagaceae bacterium]
MRNFRFLLIREFKLFRSNRVFVAAFLFMPFAMAFILGNVYKKGKVTGLPVVVVDNDQTPSSNKFCDMLEDHPSLRIIRAEIELGNVQQLMHDQRAIAVVVIPSRFEAGLLRRQLPEINCYLNMSNTVTAGAVGTAVSVCAGTMNAGILISSYQKKGIPASIAVKQYEAFKHNVFYQYNPSGNYLYYLWPGLIFSIIQQLLLLALAVSFSGEMERGAFTGQGLLACSRSPLLLIIVKITPYVIMGMLNIGVYFLLSMYFSIPFPRHPATLLVSQLLLVVGSSLLGVLYSIIIPLSLKASQLLMSIASPAFTISGFTWPQVPSVLTAISNAIPLTPYLQIMRMTLFQQAGWTDVLPKILHQIILAAAFLLLSMLLLYIKIKKALRTGNNNSQAAVPA